MEAMMRDSRSSRARMLSDDVECPKCGFHGNFVCITRVQMFSAEGPAGERAQEFPVELPGLRCQVCGHEFTTQEQSQRAVTEAAAAHFGAQAARQARRRRRVLLLCVALVLATIIFFTPNEPLHDPKIYIMLAVELLATVAV